MSSQVTAEGKDDRGSKINNTKSSKDNIKSKSKQITSLAIEMPEGITANMDGDLLIIKGPLGECRKDFSKIKIKLSCKENKVEVQSLSKKKLYVSIVNTTRSLIKNMINGVTKGFTYKLKIVYAHFPISVSVKDKNVVIENYFGERAPRIAKIVGDCKVKTKDDDVLVEGISLEDVGQTAANIEQATKVKRKDQRVFLDGIYVYEKQKV